MAKKLFLDLETRSPVPIAQGVAKYSTKVQIIMAQWAIDDGPVTVEDLTGSPPPSLKLLEAAVKCDEIWAHGAEFEQHALATVPWWPSWQLIPLTKWRCTMALARMHGLPGGLDKLSTIFKLGVDEAKDKIGHALILLFCIPREDGGYNDKHSHPNEWKQFLVYGGLDVHAMRAVYRDTPKWNATPRMWAIWHLDQRMNTRGVAMDLKLARGAMVATANAKNKLAQRTEELTDGEVERTTQRDRLLAYLESYGVSLPDLTAATVERRLEDESLPESIKELLRVRQQASKASTAKYKRVLNEHVEGRMRNMLVFCGAARTGRWAGRKIQPHNFPRPKHERWDIEHAIARFQDGTIDAYAPDDVLGLAASSLRGLLVSGPSKKLVASDYANIEGRYMAWVAGEQWKIEAFEAFDRKEGPDLYKLSYGRALNVDPETVKDDSLERQIGKVMELALQYYGGVGAFCSMADTYGLKLDVLAKAAWPVIPANIKRDAQAAWHKAVKRKRTYGLEEHIWIVCHALVLTWRAAHPAICTFWAQLDQACKMALKVPNKEYPVGQFISVDRIGNWLRIKLPSGRYLNYPAPLGDDFSSSFLGVDPYTKQWKRLSTYSGKRAENIVQGGAADIMMDGLMAAETEGFNCVLSVHDEAITEPPDTPEFTHERLSQILVESSLWADGLPLAAKGFTAYRYRK